jgi:hypothetical protein
MYYKKMPLYKVIEFNQIKDGFSIALFLETYYYHRHIEFCFRNILMLTSVYCL